MQRRTHRYRVRGAVQGVGFRPFVHRLATDLGLDGWVRNDPSGVVVEVVGSPESLSRFERALREKTPPPAQVMDVALEMEAATSPAHGFRILESESGGDREAFVLPDLAPCAECLAELRDPKNRRYRYPFLNCTHCGPRFSIVTDIPYDRANTTMRGFTMCAACRAEYEDPSNRRFHAQPNACPDCGPQLEWRDAETGGGARREDALRAAVAAIRSGRIVAVKGVGGFHLFVDARDEGAVRRLRQRKRREDKPFALLVPDLAAARVLCEVSDAEAQRLNSSAAPIVLLKRRGGALRLASSVAPDNPYLGLMRPCSPLHDLLARELGFPVVATSGNLSDEPICTDLEEARARLANIADAFLSHDRPIARPVDDSVVCVVAGRPMVLRRSRGYAPLPIFDRRAGRGVHLSVGAHLKNTVAIRKGDAVFVSQHLGDLETEPSVRAFEEAAASLQRLYEAKPDVVVCDLHPDYRSTEYARRTGLPMMAVQHHHAHVAAVLAEHEVEEEVLGVAWDGTGLGADGTIWGGEFLVATRGRFERVARFRPFRLPGGDAAMREPARSAAGILHALGEPLSMEHGAAWGAMMEKGVNAPWTSSAGRLFDAASWMLGLCDRITHEGRAAMRLEWAAAGASETAAFEIPIRESDGIWELDWGPMMRDISAWRGDPAGAAAGFHHALVEAIVAVAKRSGRTRVALGGGCFQNRHLLERAVDRLLAEGFEPLWPRDAPPNDGGIAFGQAVVAAARVGRG